MKDFRLSGITFYEKRRQRHIHVKDFLLLEEGKHTNEKIILGYPYKFSKILQNNKVSSVSLAAYNEHANYIASVASELYEDFSDVRIQKANRNSLKSFSAATPNDKYYDLL